MIKESFLGAAIIAIVFTIYIIIHPLTTRLQTALMLVSLNAMTIVFMSFAFKDNTMIRGNFLGGAIVAVVYTFYVATNPLVTRSQTALVLVILNALIILLMTFAIK